MSLEQELAERRTSSAGRMPAAKYNVMQRSTRELQKINLSDNALKSENELPSFELPDIHGKTVKSDDLLKDGPLVISFYRGGWCPYCNMELRALQNILPQIKEAGAQLVAISPETPDNSLSTAEKNELTFKVLSDIDNAYAKELGLVFQMPEDLQEVYHSFNLHVDQHNGNEDYELPMPATYVVDKNGEVIFDFVLEDYTYRLEPDEILKALKTIR